MCLMFELQDIFVGCFGEIQLYHKQAWLYIYDGWLWLPGQQYPLFSGVHNNGCLKSLYAFTSLVYWK